MVKATSSAEKGVPSEKRSPSRSSKVIVFPPFVIFHEVARSRLKFLRQPVDAHQHAAGQVADGFRGIVGGQQRVERFRF